MTTRREVRDWELEYLSTRVHIIEVGLYRTSTVRQALARGMGDSPEFAPVPPLPPPVRTYFAPPPPRSFPVLVVTI